VSVLVLLYVLSLYKSTNTDRLPPLRDPPHISATALLNTARQYVYFCTSNASKLSTFAPIRQELRRGAERVHLGG
jgi:hypothetical protein